MPGVPNDVVFAHPNTGAITWGDVRGNPASAYRIQCLAARLRTFMVQQFAELEKKKVNAPFVVGMSVMSGIEILGEIFYSKPEPRNAKDASKAAFCRFCAKVDQRFGRAPNQDFKDAFEERWNDGRPDTIAEVFYKYFRNSLVHGYYGRSVFLSGDTPNLTARDDGCVLVHPDWLLKKFIQAAEREVAEVLAAQPQNRARRNALNYLHGLLDEPEDPE